MNEIEFTDNELLIIELLTEFASENWTSFLYFCEQRNIEINEDNIDDIISLIQNKVIK